MSRAIAALVACSSLGACLLGTNFEKVPSASFCRDTPVVATPPSCTGTTSNICGKSYDDDCCATIHVPCGKHKRDYDGGEFDNDSNVASVSDFLLDKYEVTVSRFRQWVDMGGGTVTLPPTSGTGAHPLYQNSGWSAADNTELFQTTADFEAALECDILNATWTTNVESNENRPINCVTWYEAMAFCIWDGGRLATEAEWHYAAAGGDQQRVYPWSSPPDEQLLNPVHAVYGCDPDETPQCAINVVGSKSPEGNGRWGHADLSGNLAEWLIDHKDWSHQQTTYVKPCDDCLQIDNVVHRALRGGAFDSVPSNRNDLKVSFADSIEAGVRSPAFGIRCVRDIR